MSKSKVTHIEMEVSEKEYISFKQALLNNEVDSFFKNYAKDDSISVKDVASLFLIFAVLCDDAQSVGYLLSRNDASCTILTTTNNAGQSAIAVALGTSTSEEILSYIRIFIEENKNSCNKSSIDKKTIEALAFSMSGGEFFTKEETIETYLKPLYYDDDLLQI